MDKKATWDEYLMLQFKIAEILGLEPNLTEEDEAEEQVKVLLNRVSRDNLNVKLSIEKLKNDQDSIDIESLKQEEKLKSVQVTFKAYESVEFDKVESYLQAEVEQFVAKRDIFDGKIVDLLSSIFSTEARLCNIQEQLVEIEKENQGLHVIDFEQLKLDNHNLREKIKCRSVDCEKAAAAVESCIHIMAHMKEKLNFLEGKNALSCEENEELKVTLMNARKRLKEVFMQKQKMLKETENLATKYKLLKSPMLLRNMEKIEKDIEGVIASNESLKEKLKFLLVPAE